MFQFSYYYNGLLWIRTYQDRGSSGNFHHELVINIFFQVKWDDKDFLISLIIVLFEEMMSDNMVNETETNPNMGIRRWEEVINSIWGYIGKS